MFEVINYTNLISFCIIPAPVCSITAKRERFTLEIAFQEKVTSKKNYFKSMSEKRVNEYAHSLYFSGLQNRGT